MSKDNPKATCENCRYYLPYGYPEFGECRRYPKILNDIHENYWCGDFKLNVQRLEDIKMKKSDPKEPLS